MSEIRLFAGSFSPRAWFFCHGQQLPIANFTALFSLIGTLYGGDGRSTFGLPDFRGRVPVGSGTGPGLPPFTNGQIGGVESVTLSTLEIPSHTHTATVSSTDTFQIRVNNGTGTSTTPGGKFIAQDSNGSDIFSTSNDGNTLNTNEFTGTISSTLSVSSTGGNQAHDNMQPWLALNYIICYEGVFPMRS